jgi:aminoglycoside phosphotransferase (APT) family kinase protein
VEIPEPTWVASDFSFFGYRYLRGATLEDREDLVETPSSQSQFVDHWLELVTTLQQLVPLEKARALGVRPFTHVTHRLGLVHTARASGVIPSAVDDLARQVLEEYDERCQRAARSRSVTMHGDLGLSHWLIDEHNRPYAVIDWSDACLAPVEHELANLYWTNEGARSDIGLLVRDNPSDPEIAKVIQHLEVLVDLY